jgi:aspartyl-tRNA(Asn)/glutamyl-tRNA(Gln) amidotransferase subunit A
MGPTELTAIEILAAIASRSLSDQEVIAAAADVIDRSEPSVHAFITTCLDEALERAAKSRPGPLAGLPLGVKDMFDTSRCPTTYGSSMFADHVPASDAAVVERIEGAGAIVVGKTSTHEFGWGITSVNAHYGTPCNPWDARLIPGGSSGGSASAVAHGLVPVALGSDTGGSIRVPAACCGVVGFKPSFGRVSRRGAFPLAQSLDHPGVIARTPADAALVYRVIKGEDPGDPSTVGAFVDRADRRRGGPATIGVDINPSPAPDESIRRTVCEAAATLAAAGLRLNEIELPAGEVVYDAFRPIQGAEVLDTHRRAGLYPRRRDEYGADVLGRLDAASEISTADYLRASRSRAEITAAYSAVFEHVDVVVSPVMAVAPITIGSESVERGGRDVPFRDLVLPFTAPQDLLGLPACAVRAGFDGDGLPIAVQITGPRGADELVLSVAQTLYDETAPVQAVTPGVR